MHGDHHIPRLLNKQKINIYNIYFNPSYPYSGGDPRVFWLLLNARRAGVRPCSRRARHSNENHYGGECNVHTRRIIKIAPDFRLEFHVKWMDFFFPYKN